MWQCSQCVQQSLCLIRVFAGVLLWLLCSTHAMAQVAGLHPATSGYSFMPGFMEKPDLSKHPDIARSSGLSLFQPQHPDHSLAQYGQPHNALPPWLPGEKGSPNLDERAQQEREELNELRERIREQTDLQAEYRSVSDNELVELQPELNSENEDHHSSKEPVDADNASQDKNENEKDTQTKEQDTGQGEDQGQPQNPVAATPLTTTTDSSTTAQYTTSQYHVAYVGGNAIARSSSFYHPVDGDTQTTADIHALETSQNDDRYWGDPPSFQFNTSPIKVLFDHIHQHIEKIANTDQELHSDTSAENERHIQINIIVSVAGIHDDAAYEAHWVLKHRDTIQSRLKEHYKQWQNKFSREGSPITLDIRLHALSDQAAYFGGFHLISDAGQSLVMMIESHGLALRQNHDSKQWESEVNFTPFGGYKHLGYLAMELCKQANPNDPANTCANQFLKRLNAAVSSVIIAKGALYRRLNVLGMATMIVRQQPDCPDEVRSTIDGFCTIEIDNTVKLIEEAYRETPFTHLTVAGPFAEALQEPAPDQDVSYFEQLKNKINEKLPEVHVVGLSNDAFWKHHQQFAASQQENGDHSLRVDPSSFNTEAATGDSEAKEE